MPGYVPLCYGISVCLLCCRREQNILRYEIQAAVGGVSVLRGTLFCLQNVLSCYSARICVLGNQEIGGKNSISRRRVSVSVVTTAIHM